MAKLKAVIKLGDRVTFLGPDERGYEVWVERISPERAAFLMAHLGVQRHLRAKHVEVLAKAMKLGHWMDMCGKYIIFDEEGLLIDGQHRCQAVINSGVTIHTWATNNVNANKAMFVIDQFQSDRKFSDVLVMKGEKYATELASAVQWLSRWKEGVMHDQRVTVDNFSAYQLLKKHPHLRHSVAWCMNLRTAAPVKIFSAAPLGFFHYVFSRINNDIGLAFVEKITWQSDSRPDKECPACILRDRLLRSKEMRKRSDYLSGTDRMALTVKAWNFYVQQQRCKPIHLRWPAGEKFPSICNEDGQEVVYSMIKD